MHLLDLSFIVELLSDSRVFQAVLKHGGGQWFSIGLAMGFTGSEVEVCTSNKPSSGSKLQEVIEWKVRECGVKETEKCVLTACEGIPQPIIGSVLEYIERGSKGMSQHESVEGGYDWFLLLMTIGFVYLRCVCCLQMMALLLVTVVVAIDGHRHNKE